MRFGSVCSGIEAASVAWHPLGWSAAWLSEIEPFPSAVLAHHYPDVPNLGDMTTLPERIASGEVESPDVFCGGTPCQAFSVAGTRRSLDDARGNLSLTFCEIANAIDNVRRAQGRQPTIVFWENVPGVLSTKDNAFGCFLAGLAGEDDPLIPPGDKWENAGCVYGPKRAVAWRILDAQYFGVAQRRRRVFVVASARDGFDPASVLFEFEGLRRDSAPRRETGKAAPTIPSRSTAGGGLGTDFDLDGGLLRVAGTLTANTGGMTRPAGNANELDFCVPVRRWPAEVASTLDTTFGTKRGLEDQHVNAGCQLFVPVQTFSTPAIGHIVRDDLSSTMTKHTGSGAGETQNPAFVVQPLAFHPTQDPTPAYALRTANTGANGHGISEEMAHTLDTVQGQAVAQPMPVGIFQDSEFGVQKYDSAGTLRAGRIPEHQMVMQPISFHPTQDPISSADVCHSIGTDNGQGCATAAVLTGGLDYEANGHEADEPTGPLLKGSPTGGGNRLPAVSFSTMQVRRLTPVECERLQGFPDGYTAIPWRKKTADECPDGPRYKALGNSWAVPVVRWIGKRISQEIMK